ncbi:MAG: 16S rRNA (cytosine(967)-C(5))-methyltransferase RsmB [Verrucomicrobiales bacterium]
MPDPNARQTALLVLRRWEEGSGHIDELIAGACGRGGVGGADRAFVQALCLGVVRNLTLIDELIGELRKGAIKPEPHRILRLGVFQLLFLGVPDHAAINETVSLARGKAERGLVNAILRNVIRQRDLLKVIAESYEPAIRYSIPDFLYDRWLDRFGEAEAEALAAWCGQPSDVYVRANRLQPGAEDRVAAAEGCERVPGTGAAFFKAATLPEALLADGTCYAQDPSTELAVNLLDPQPGESILDACAAPGGKAALIAERMGNAGKIVACDASEHRLPRLRENLDRLGASIAEVAAHRFGEGEPPFPAASFDRILIDAPCSNTGVLRRRADAKWRLHERVFAAMQENQLAIATACAPLLKPGGVLVYSTCSIEPEENADAARRIASEAGLTLDRQIECLPQRDGFDGAYAARLVREG